MSSTASQHEKRRLSFPGKPQVGDPPRAPRMARGGRDRGGSLTSIANQYFASTELEPKCRRCPKNIFQEVFDFVMNERRAFSTSALRTVSKSSPRISAILLTTSLT